MDPEQVASYVRAAMHQDRSPGRLLVVLHPFRRYKLPRTLFDDLRDKGFDIRICETAADRIASVRQIREAFEQARNPDIPLDVLVVAGDGTLDHHVLVAAFWAMHPDLVRYREGEITIAPLTSADTDRIPHTLSTLRTPPDTSHLKPDEETIKTVWRLRLLLGPRIRRGDPLLELAARAERPVDDTILRLAVLAAVLPERVALRPDGFDLSGLAAATEERTFQGLYGFVRSITVYPAGTASDNAVFAGVPGWVYAQLARVLAGPAWLDPLRRLLERRVAKRFVHFFSEASVVVPARFSLVRLDGDWQAVSSHAVGGPGSGRMFAGDLGGKSEGLLGYLLALPSFILQEGVFGSTILKATLRDTDGEVRAETTSQLAEGLYTNRTFIAGLGSIPSTDPTSFAGRSTYVAAPPIVGRDPSGRLQLQLSGLGTLIEGAIKGISARLLHLIGIDPGTLAGGGRIWSAWPEHQLTLSEGEEIELAFQDRDGNPRVVPTQVSGDPYQAFDLGIRVAWGPLPLLAADGSLLLASTRRSLGHLRMQSTWKLDEVFIGGLRYFRHDAGDPWARRSFESRGMFLPPLTLRRSLLAIQRQLVTRWEGQGLTGFTDTSDPGFQLERRGRYAHSGDQTGHLVILRETRDSLLVRLVRAHDEGALIVETRSRYRAIGLTWVIHESETRECTPGEAPRVVQESHFFRSAETLRREAPALFPFSQPDTPPENETS